MDSPSLGSMERQFESSGAGNWENEACFFSSDSPRFGERHERQNKSSQSYNHRNYLLFDNYRLKPVEALRLSAVPC